MLNFQGVMVSLPYPALCCNQIARHKALATLHSPTTYVPSGRTRDQTEEQKHREFLGCCLTLWEWKMKLVWVPYTKMNTPLKHLETYEVNVNQWLEDYFILFPYWNSPSLGDMLVFWNVNYICPLWTCVFHPMTPRFSILFPPGLVFSYKFT